MSEDEVRVLRLELLQLKHGVEKWSKRIDEIDKLLGRVADKPDLPRCWQCDFFAETPEGNGVCCMSVVPKPRYGLMPQCAQRPRPEQVSTWRVQYGTDASEVEVSGG